MTRAARVTAFLAATSLAVGLLSAAPATADDPVAPFTDLVGRLLGQQPAAESDAAPRKPADYGRTAARNGTLRTGCHNYRYDYRVSAPSTDWALETFLRSPRGKGLASGTFLSDSDPRKQRTRFRFCSSSTRSGTFTIQALVHWYDDYGVEHQIWLDPSRFRLRRAS